MISLRFLIFIPVVAYILSYLYLAYYHGKFFIFNTIIHESGKYTLLQDMFYASHFLGHIPVHSVLALLFTGTYLCLSKTYYDTYPKKSGQKLFVWLLLFLISSFFLSLTVFGYEDTFSFICQQKQGVGIYAEGGAWNLHLPSTIMLFVLVPVYIYFFKKICDKSIIPNFSGLFYISIGFIFFLSFTFFLNKNMLSTLTTIWRDPRYLAHSVRELMTFPVTYFPVPLFYLLRKEGKSRHSEINMQDKSVKYFIACLAFVFLVGLFYQSYIPLAEGIGNLAQKPDFAKSGKLGIPYLLASHYFEHFLDTIYFTLLCLLLHVLALNKANRLRGDQLAALWRFGLVV